MARVFRARWVLPITQPPIRDGWVAVEGGRITGVGGPESSPVVQDPVAQDPVAQDFSPADYESAILPGLVNAHTHLELSYLHERIPPAPSFGAWVAEVMRLRQQYPDPADPRIVDAARRSIADARAAGTALFGEVSNTLVTVPLLREAGVAAQVFHELTGFTEQDPEARVKEARARVAALGGDTDDLRISVAPHAPYSVSAALFQAIRADLDRHPRAVSTVHLGETPEETELLRTGTGGIRSLLEQLGRWPSDWRAPGVGAVEYLTKLGVIDSRILAVHGVQFDGDDMAQLRALGVTVVSCPRSNRCVGVGSPPLEAFYASSLPVAFGTDSLASVADLNLFSELAEARRIAPHVPAKHLLESATLVGARALRFEEDFGSIEVGKRAELLVVRLPDAMTDVEEYLVSTSPLDITWLGAG